MSKKSSNYRIDIHDQILERYNLDLESINRRFDQLAIRSLAKTETLTDLSELVSEYDVFSKEELMAMLFSISSEAGGYQAQIQFMLQMFGLSEKEYALILAKVNDPDVLESMINRELGKQNPDQNLLNDIA